MTSPTDPFERELTQARESVDVLAREVDTDAAWNAVSAATERAPRARGLRRMQLAAVLIAVVAAVGAVVYARTGDQKSSPETTRTPPRTSRLADCTLPALPEPGRAAPPRSEPSLSGAAVASLQGGPARSQFALGGGEFTVSPPRADDEPSVTAKQAECAALATSNGDGWSLLDSASRYGGAAVGYARVSVSPQLIADATNSAATEGQTDQDTHPKLPAATQYRDRLAWVVVVERVTITHGGGAIRQGDPTPTTAPPRPNDSYDVFLVDAETGTDALIYSSGDVAGATGTVSIPAERVSVPWTLVSRSPNGYSGEVRATVLPCDGIPNPVRVDEYRRAAAVVVERPVGAECGAPKQVTLPIVAPNVTWDLPPEITHDPLGPAVFPEEHAPSGGQFSSRCSNGPASECVYNGPDSTGGVLRMLEASDNGTTVNVKRGSVFTVGPIQIGNRFAARPAASSDAAVLGMFPGSKIHEFRAWRVGNADLFIPTNACDPSQGIGVPCTPPWIVHVNITG